MPGTFLTSDLIAMLSTAEFATTATRAVGGTTFSAIFDVPYRPTDVGIGEMESLAPSFIARTTEVTGDAIGAQIAIGGINYKILGKEPMEPDGALTRVILRRAT